MTRKDRRIRRKTALRVLSGGKPADAPRADERTPAGRLAVKLDRFLQQEVAAEPAISQYIVTAVLLRMVAGLVAESDMPTAEVLRALDVFIDQEREARKKPAPASTEPRDPEGA